MPGSVRILRCVLRVADLSKTVVYSIAWHDHLLDGL